MKRFEVKSIAPNNHVTLRRVDTVVEAWNWYAFFTKVASLNVVEVVDHEQDVAVG